ncbi:MAG: TIGR03905 family TSCPD domain-containing protein [Ruminococcus sp.]|uniref:TIGR03905 family TSCPD domain-containing protein n=1 Tax=Ruminococcus sp. TaxID=41978 RepID=UPI0025FF8415|nr:TIGR03905 family TSCPD domain-containing protein [Ruminococcus sp.]MBR5682167.1 TIGR03905 family TSCPD domain-containing protein [Ruminococcus sp.]
MKYTYKTKMVCSQEISFDINGDVITNIAFVGGCNGNLKAISKVLDGWTVEQIEAKLKGNTCGVRPTSCADQLCIAVRKAYEEQKNS